MKVKIKKNKLVYKVSLVLLAFFCLAMPFLSLASSFNDLSSYADENTDYFTGSGVSFLNYTGETYRDTFARVYGFNCVTNQYGSSTINYYLKIVTPLQYNTRAMYFTSNSASADTYASEGVFGFNHSYTSSNGFNTPRLLGAYNSYARQFSVNSAQTDWVAASGWLGDTYRLRWHVTYSPGIEGSSNFGSVVGVRFGSVLGIENSNFSYLFNEYNIYVDSASLGSSTTLFILQLFDENNCAINFIFENKMQYANSENMDLWSLFNNPTYPQIRTYYIVNTESSQYLQGYNDGYDRGEYEGSLSGYQDGYDAGSRTGYDSGFNEGVLSANEYSFLGLIGAVIDAPIQAFNGLLNFEILGLNMRDFYLGLFSVCIIVFIVRMVLLK